MATAGQFQYLRKLVGELEDKGVEVSCEIEEKIKQESLTDQEASELIDDLKFELGWRDNE